MKTEMKFIIFFRKSFAMTKTKKEIKTQTAITGNQILLIFNISQSRNALNARIIEGPKNYKLRLDRRFCHHRQAG